MFLIHRLSSPAPCLFARHPAFRLVERVASLVEKKSGGGSGGLQAITALTVYICVFLLGRQKHGAGVGANKRTEDRKRERRGGEGVCVHVCFIYFDRLLTAWACFWCCRPIIHLELNAVWTTRPIKLYTSRRIELFQRHRDCRNCTQDLRFTLSLSSQLWEVWGCAPHLSAARGTLRTR